MTQHDKLNEIRDEVYRSGFQFPEKIRDMILAQIDRLDTLCTDYQACIYDSAKTFGKGLLYGALSVFNSEVVPLLSNIELWINPDELVAELELDKVREELRVDE